MNTFARAHSLLIGAAAAAVTASVGQRRRLTRPTRLAVLTAVAVAGAIVLVSNQRSDWLFTWGFPVFALAVVVIVVAAAGGAGAPVLASHPFRWVGDRSYGIYLWHWPVFLRLSADRLPVNGAAARPGPCHHLCPLAAASYRWLEMPIRSRRRLTAPWAPGLAIGALAAAFAVLAIRPPTTAVPAAPSTVTLPAVPTGTSAAVRQMSRVATGPLSSIPMDITGVVAVVHVGLPLPQRVLVVGDSTAMQLADALLAYAADHGDQLLVGSAASPGCGLTAATDGRLHEFSSPDGIRELIDLSGCTRQWTSIADRVASDEQIDVVVVQISSWDGIDIQLADGRIVSVSDPVGRRLVADAYRGFVTEVEAEGARVVWVTPPDIHLLWGAIDAPMNDPRRWAAMREVVDGCPWGRSISTRGSLQPGSTDPRDALTACT